MPRMCRCVRCGDWVGGTSQREVCQVCRVCSLEERLGELSGRLISVEEEIRGIRKEVGEVQRDDLVARLVRVEEALRGFPSLPDFTGRVALSSFDSASSADSQVASNWAQVVKGAKVKRSQEAVIKTENKFLGLREVSLDDGTEGGVETGVRSAGRAQAVLKGRGKTRALVIVGDSNVRRLEGAMEKDSGAQVSFSQFPGARIEHIRDRIGSVVCSESAEEVSVVLHVGTNDTPKSGSELIMGRLRQAIRACREARSGVRVTVCAIPSRLDKGGITWSRSEGVNDRLKELCIAEGAVFLDTREALSRCRSPMARDGVHFSKEGAVAVGLAIMKENEPFLGL